jgi:hypothetical protein
MASKHASSESTQRAVPAKRQLGDDLDDRSLGGHLAEATGSEDKHVRGPARR